MNLHLLNKEVQDYITNNLNTEISKLIFKGTPFPNVSIQEIAEQVVSKNKCLNKLPSWYHTANIYYPNKLNLEQTSSEISANFKAKLISGDSLIDLTGGFGVDCLAFSKRMKQIVHCEINTELSEIVQHNLQQLEIRNITTIPQDGISFIKNNPDNFDWIYIDPSRRNNFKGKVFRFEDCLPNVPEYLSVLFQKTNNILVKASPIHDLNLGINELRHVKMVHIVAIKNEVKELLFTLNKEKNPSTTISIDTINITKKETQRFSFEYRKKVTGTYSTPLTYIYEPNAAILKSGGFQEVSNQLNIPKLHKHSHLYTSDTLIKFPGRTFKVVHNIPFEKKQLNRITPTKKANITTRNFPQTVAQIRKKTGIKDGGSQYLFFTRDLHENLIVLDCVKN